MLDHTPKTYGSLEHGKRSPQKKAIHTVTKFKGAHLLKWLAAYCVLNCVSATAVTGPSESALLPTCGIIDARARASLFADAGPVPWL